MSEDDTNPMPHIALSATAPKSVYYRKIGSLAIHPAPELRELRLRTDWNGGPACQLDSFPRTAGLREVCYRAKAAGTRAR